MPYYDKYGRVHPDYVRKIHAMADFERRTLCGYKGIKGENLRPLANPDGVNCKNCMRMIENGKNGDEAWARKHCECGFEHGGDPDVKFLHSLSHED